MGKEAMYGNESTNLPFLAFIHTVNFYLFNLIQITIDCINIYDQPHSSIVRIFKTLIYKCTILKVYNINFKNNNIFRQKNNYFNDKYTYFI